MIGLIAWVLIVILFGVYILPFWFLPFCIIAPILAIYVQDKINRKFSK